MFQVRTRNNRKKGTDKVKQPTTTELNIIQYINAVNGKKANKKINIRNEIKWKPKTEEKT